MFCSVLVRTLFPSQTVDLLLSSHMMEGTRELDLITSQRPHLLDTITLRLGFYLVNLEGTQTFRGFLGGASGKEPTYQCRRLKVPGFNPWVGKIPWRRAWQSTQVFLPGEFHG